MVKWLFRYIFCKKKVHSIMHIQSEVSWFSSSFRLYLFFYFVRNNSRHNFDAILFVRWYHSSANKLFDDILDMWYKARNRSNVSLWSSETINISREIYKRRKERFLRVVVYLFIYDKMKFHVELFAWTFTSTISCPFRRTETSVTTLISRRWISTAAIALFFHWFRSFARKRKKSIQRA